MSKLLHEDNVDKLEVNYNINKVGNKMSENEKKI